MQTKCNRLYIEKYLSGLFIDYRIKSTTEKAIYTLINEVLKALNKLMVGGIFCDLEKVFGSI
jgi:hypothetical protein